MKKTVLLSGLFIAVLLNVQAQAPSQGLAKLLQGKQIDRVVNEIYEITPDSTKQSVLTKLNGEKEIVLNKIAASYSEQFSEQEIQQLFDFLSSPLAQKWRAFRGDLVAKNSEVIMEWGMKLRENQ
jgi:hypothetical protein